MCRAYAAADAAFRSDFKPFSQFFRMHFKPQALSEQTRDSVKER